MRKPIGHTQDEIAAALGCSQATVSRAKDFLEIEPRPDGGYHLADVLKIAERRAGRNRGPGLPDTLDLIEKASELAVMPALLANRHLWIFVAVGAHRNGMTRAAAADMYLAACCGMVYAAADASRYPADFEVTPKPGCLFETALAAKEAGTLDAWAEQHWPDVEMIAAEAP